MRYLLPLLILISCSTTKLPPPLEKVEGKTHFCVVGDTGNGSRFQYRVARAMEKSGCERLVILGDVIYESGIDSSGDYQLEEKFNAPYRNFDSITIVLGNHDYRGNPGAWKEIALRDKRIIHPSNFFVERVEKTCLFFLDTNFDSDKTLFEKESQWIGEELKTCEKSIAFTHHPYLNSGASHGHATGLQKKFFEESILGKFLFIFSGHEHVMKDEGLAKGTRQYVAGTGGKKARRQYPGFILFTLDPISPEESEVRMRILK